jgi:hypothetical protein
MYFIWFLLYLIYKENTGFNNITPLRLLPNLNNSTINNNNNKSFNSKEINNNNNNLNMKNYPLLNYTIENRR